MTQRISHPSGLLASTPIPTRDWDGSVPSLINNDILKGSLFLAECEDKVDPDTILLPGVGGHNLNTLEEFELDYSQVGGREGRGSDVDVYI